MMSAWVFYTLPSMIVPAFLAFVAATALSDIIGPGHQWVGLALGTLWFFFCRNLSLDAWRWLLSAALALSVAIAALAVAQMFVMPRACGPFASPNFLGAYAVLMFFCCVGVSSQLSTQWRWVTGAATANLLSLAISQSRGALLALGAGLTVMLWRRFGALPLMVAVMAVVLIRPGVDEARWAIWRLGWNAAIQRPITGWGQGGLVVGGLDRFYSIPLEVFAASGILGLAAGAWLLVEAGRCAYRINDTANHADNPDNDSKPHQQFQGHAFLAAWFVQGLFLFSIPATNILLVMVLGLASRLSSEISKSIPQVHRHSISS